MLLVLPVPIRRDDKGGWLVELQAGNGLRRWAGHFGRVTAACPVLDATRAGGSSIVWVGAAAALAGTEVRLVGLPDGYVRLGWLKHRAEAARLLEPLIREHRYLHFGIGGCTGGDWGALAARIARRLGRAYAVHTDWVTHAMTKPTGWGVRAVRQRWANWRMRRAEREVISGAALGMFHGADTYAAYHTWCRVPTLVHDSHVPASALPSAADVEAKRVRVLGGGPLKLVYAGRAAAMKGPMDWLRVMKRLAEKGVAFEATWYGDGPELGAMRAFVEREGLSGRVRLAGFVADRQEMMRALREADVMVFCHLTPESPRNLIESLTQGTPVVGYRSAYAAELVSAGGGRLVEMGDVERLACAVAEWAEERSKLAEEVGRAAAAGSQLTDEAVFAHRAELTKAYLP
ncbi:MAG: glycosyltransferase [Tepidisphaerales bacterium]